MTREAAQHRNAGHTARADRVAGRGIAAALAELGPEWVVFHDVRWPGRTRGTIDYVVIGPSGIFVIDQVNWSGSVTLTAGVLRHNDEDCFDTVESVKAAARAVAAVAGYAVEPVLCFARPDLKAGRAGWVLASGPTDLPMMLDLRPVLLTPERVTEFADRLEQVLEPVNAGASMRANTRRRRVAAAAMRVAVLGSVVGAGLSFVGSMPSVVVSLGSFGG